MVVVAVALVAFYKVQQGLWQLLEQATALVLDLEELQPRIRALPGQLGEARIFLVQD
jgi:hypothetical protein